MKCRSVACIWPESPPSHCVTATATLNNPPTLYTGAADGSIIWWNLCPTISDVEIKAVAMLCGHAAAISDLEICYPMLKLGENQPLTGGALISASRDGVLCVWSRSSGHCRRRRKLTLSGCSPTILRHLPSCPRYLCIGCFTEDSIGIDADGRQESCIVIVDTYDLSIVQKIFHGHLNVGTFKYMHVVLSGEDTEQESVMVVDSYGRTGLIPILKEDYINNEMYQDSQSEEAFCREYLTGRGDLISCAAQGNFVAYLFKKSCIFRLLNGSICVGEISFDGSSLYVKNEVNDVQVSGCMFKARDDFSIEDRVDQNNFVGKFCIWNNVGSFILYEILYSNNVFKFYSLLEIPVFDHGVSEAHVSFGYVNNYHVRISLCSYGETRCWSPRITVWPINGNHQSGFYEKCVQPIGRMDAIYGSAVVKQVVSSSMVISENLLVPYAVVYGYFNGEIEVIRFDMFLKSETPCGSPRVNLDTLVSRQHFLGHTGSVLCLAAHRMPRLSGENTSNWILVSGSADCTIRIWDIDCGSLLTVMHHHVSSVHQLIFPHKAKPPWTDCFLSVGADDCVALTSLETLRVERFLSGHRGYPEKVVWDGFRGYVACLCKRDSVTSDSVEVLYIWDVMTGVCECLLDDADAHLFFEKFCSGIDTNSSTGSVLRGSTSLSSLQLPIIENGTTYQSSTILEKQMVRLNMNCNSADAKKTVHSVPLGSTQCFVEGDSYPILCICPFPGIAALTFDLASLMQSYQTPEIFLNNRKSSDCITDHRNISPKSQSVDRCSSSNGFSAGTIEVPDSSNSLEELLLCFTLSFLHIWNMDSELDKLLISDIKVKRPKNCLVGSGMQGDNGSLTLTFPGLDPVFELWKSSSEFCAMRSLTMVSIAQRITSMCSSRSFASSALAAFYTRNLIEKMPSLMPPSLQLLVSFWQDSSEHVRMAARALFHCAASCAIPSPLCSKNADPHIKLVRSLRRLGGEDYQNDTVSCSTSDLDSKSSQSNQVIQSEESTILTWIESFQLHDWVSCLVGSTQDAMNSHIIVAAALAVWYPSLVKSCLPMILVHHLFNLVEAMNPNWSSIAAELLAEGMENTWKPCCSSDIPRLIGSIMFQIECVSTPLPSTHLPAIPASTRQILIEVLLPSLAKTDVHGFLNVIDGLIWSTSSDSVVHLASLSTIVRVVHDSPRCLAPYLDKVINFVLHTMDVGNSVLRKTCLPSSLITLKEIARTYPMICLNENATKLAVGNAVGDLPKASISIYDMQSVAKVKILDASGPPGLPSTSELPVTTLIAALSFSPDGEGLVAFSEHGLVIRWWTLGSVWWEKLSRNFVPVQCTKLIFVPPWEGFSPTTSRLSIISTVLGSDKQVDCQVECENVSYEGRLNGLLHNLDLSYRLEWVGSRNVLLTSHGKELSNVLL